MAEPKTATKARSFRFYRRDPNREYRLVKWWVSGIFILTLAMFFIWGILPEPAFNLAKLKGMTPKQIVSRFGPPDVKYTQRRQPVYVYYKALSWCDLSYAVLFKHGRVCNVAEGSH